LLALLLGSGALFGSCGHDPDAVPAPSASVHTVAATARNTTLVRALGHDVGAVGTDDPGDITVRVPIAVHP